MTYIEKLHLEAINNNICSESNYSRILGKNEAASKSAEITEQVACDFVEWISRFCYIDWDVKDKMYFLYPIPYDGEAIYDVKKLFQEYLKSIENEIQTNQQDNR